MEGIKRRHLSSQAWQQLFERHAASGEPIGTFCRREGVSTHSYRRWKLRLGETVAPALSKAAAAVKPAKLKPEQTAAFVDLGPLGATPQAAGRIELRLDLGGGLMLHVVRG
jgi:putative transposase